MNTPRRQIVHFITAAVACTLAAAACADHNKEKVQPEIRSMVRGTPAAMRERVLIPEQILLGRIHKNVESSEPGGHRYHVPETRHVK
jgi:hypothetical protein